MLAMLATLIIRLRYEEIMNLRGRGVRDFRACSLAWAFAQCNNGAPTKGTSTIQRSR